MIELVRGNLLEADAEALVNTVNCVGVMGKGVALQFRQAYPDNYQAYRRACDRHELHPGQMLVWRTDRAENPRYIINFPTKRHWKGKSRLDDIDSGLIALVAEVQVREIKSIAVPPLGCGNGGLDWADVRPRIEAAFAGLPATRVLLFEPAGSPRARLMQIGTDDPGLTRARAILILLLEQYARPGYRSTRLEIQKLAYFLQAAGEPLRLQFVKHLYGPYAENLNKVLQRLEGHYLRGYGDRHANTSIQLMPGAPEHARQFLSDAEGGQEGCERLDRVASLIEGFETPYGMELLATVHWLVAEDPSIAADENIVVERLHAWSDRKRSTFRREHILRAWEKLRDCGWLPDSRHTSACAS